MTGRPPRGEGAAGPFPTPFPCPVLSKLNYISFVSLHRTRSCFDNPLGEVSLGSLRKSTRRLEQGLMGKGKKDLRPTYVMPDKQGFEIENGTGSVLSPSETTV